MGIILATLLIVKILKKISIKKTLKILRKYLYCGNKVECPICHSAFRIFAAAGNPKRKNALCLNCGSLERHRLLWLYFNEKTDLLKPQNEIKLLHFAPEKVFFDIFANAHNILYEPCDLRPENYNFSSNTKINKVDITNVPFENNYFDFVICNHVFEHIEDDKLAMSELHRVMKKGGVGIFQVPIDYDLDETYEDATVVSPKDRERVFGQSDHCRIYGKDYAERLKQFDWLVLEDNFVSNFSPDDIFRYGLMDTELIYICRILQQ